MRYDLIVRDGSVALDDRVERLSIGVADGEIVAMEPDLAGDAGEEVDARGLFVLPGVVDTHVHFNEPGRAEWEGFVTGSAALAVGGGTCFFDMPLNASPPTIDGAAFDEKLAAARGRCAADFGLWGGIVPGNIDRMDELAERGVVGFKAFMADSGIPDFPRADDRTLLDAMAHAAKLGLPVAVHAEDEAIVSELARAARAAVHGGWREVAACRPVAAEVEAIRSAISMADETGCSLHIVHVSSAEGVALVTEAAARGIDVTCETCPHYLYFTRDEADHLGASAKCAPPLRDRDQVEALWRHLARGDIALLASDHSPSPPALKEVMNCFDAWGGIAGCQSMLAVILVEGHLGRGIPLPSVARLLSASPAARYRIPRKGRMAVGFDADMALVAPDAARELRASDLLYRHPISPYVGRRLHGFVRRTILRGETTQLDGRPTGLRPGRQLQPVKGVTSR